VRSPHTTLVRIFLQLRECHADDHELANIVIDRLDVD